LKFLRILKGLFSKSLLKAGFGGEAPDSLCLLHRYRQTLFSCLKKAQEKSFAKENAGSGGDSPRAPRKLLKKFDQNVKKTLRSVPLKFLRILKGLFLKSLLRRGSGRQP